LYNHPQTPPGLWRPHPSRLSHPPQQSDLAVSYLLSAICWTSTFTCNPRAAVLRCVGIYFFKRAAACVALCDTASRAGIAW